MPADMTLIIANKNYSSWSLRPWLALKQHGAPFEEVRIALDRPDTRARILRHSPGGKVPALHHGDLTVWDSLAILEYLAERNPGAGLWPKDAEARAVARSVSAEMHAGFMPLRQALPMNCRRREKLAITDEAVIADIARIDALWTDCRRRFGAGGPFLFGRFSNADAMYAPVVSRLASYEVEVSETAQAYMRTVLDMPEMRAWYADAEAEAEHIAGYER